MKLYKRKILAYFIYTVCPPTTTSFYTSWRRSMFVISFPRSFRCETFASILNSENVKPERFSSLKASWNIAFINIQHALRSWNCSIHRIDPASQWTVVYILIYEKINVIWSNFVLTFISIKKIDKHVLIVLIPLESLTVIFL